MNLNTQLEELKMERIKNFFNDESGAAAVEYGLLVGLIAVVIIAAVTILGTNISAKFDSAATALGS
jgi:pilus assembly protein Flp/PilA